MGDYANIVCSQGSCDDPSRSLHAIAHGDISDFFRYQPVMGVVSLAVRAPAVAVADAAHANVYDEYRAGAAVCMALACALAVWLAYLARRRGAALPPVLAVLALWLVTILWTRALFAGHPEEPLAAVLALSAIAMAAERRVVAAGILLALAVATKEWALLTAPAVFFAAPASEWRRVAAPALIGIVLLTGLMAVGNLSSFRRAHAGQRESVVHKLSPATLWYRLGEKRATGRFANRTIYESYPPTLIGRGARPFVILFGAVASLFFWRRNGHDVGRAFALAALVLLARGLFDTETVSYHLIPMLIAVGAWEIFDRKRFPIVATGAIVAMQLTTRLVLSHSETTFSAYNATYLAWTIPLFAYLAVVTFRRPRRDGP